MATFNALAEQFQAAWVSDTRTNGDKFWRLRDGSPQWMTNAVHAAHEALDDRMPDDWVYEQCAHLADDLTNYDDPDDARDASGELADGMVDVYNADRSRWLASHLMNAYLCDEAADEFGSDVDTFQRIGQGQYLALDRICHALIDSIEAEADDQDED